MSAPTLGDLKELREGTPILWMGEVMTFIAVGFIFVGRHRGEWAVWLEEVNGPIAHDRWDMLEIIP